MTAPTPQGFRDSSAVVLVRGHGDSFETFWAKRGDAVGFMPGFHAFIGGKVAPEDAVLELDGVEDDTERIFRACAIREAFEETGVLIGLAGPVAMAGLGAARRRLLEGSATFPDLALEHGWRFRGDDLWFAGRWQTPAFAAVRFDTIYYVARVPDGQEPTIEPGELASGEWIRPADAIERWHRGGATFAAPIYWTLAALAEGEQGLTERLALGPRRAGEPVRRIELRWGIVLHPMKTRPLPPATHTNAYLIGEREMLLVDPGGNAPEDLEALFALIEMLGADGRRLNLVLATHHHPDHVAGIDAVRERYRVPVAAHPDTARHLRVDFSVDDRQWLTLVPGIGDWNLQAIHTPGHTRGHLCLYHPRTRSLFTGDHIPGGRGTVIIDPPEGHMGDYLKSLDRLLELNADALFPGHGSPQGGVERRIRGLIAHRQEREAKVLAALSGSPRTVPELVERAYTDTKRELWGYAARSLLAHLEKLESEGRAAREGERWSDPAYPRGKSDR